MVRRQPRSTRTYTPLPYTTLFRAVQQVGQAVGFRVDHAQGVGHGVAVEDLAAKAHRCAVPGRKPGRVDRHVRVGLQHSQGDARVAVVETAADPGAVDADHVDDAAGFGPLRRLVDQLLEDPRMAAAPGVAQVDGGDGVRSEEHTSELQSLMRISYAVFCLNTKKN